MTTQTAATPRDSTLSVSSGRGWKTLLLISALLFAGTSAVFWTACQNGFVNWDDNSYVCNRLEVLNGLNAGGILWAMTSQVCGNWHPLTMMSLQLDAQIFGAGPVGFHRTAVLLHAVNAVLVFLTIRAFTGCLWKSAIVAALFAVHPLRVESVAWVSERKDLLSGFFFCLTLLAHARYVNKPSAGRLLLVALLLALGLSSKSMLVTTPCLLLLLDYWPLGRARAPSMNPWPDRVKWVVEKIPLFGLSVLFSVLTVIYQGTAISTLTHIPLTDRVENAVVSYVAYLAQTCWPFGLSPLYPVREIPFWKFGVAISLVAALTGFAVWQRTQRPYLLVGWLWFLGMLVPVSGIIQVGSQARADRYTYLPHIGLFIAVVWAVADLTRHSRRISWAATWFVAAFLTGCVCVTILQIPVWRDTVSLWRQAYSLYPNDCHVAQNLIKALVNRGNRDEALELTRKMLRSADETDINTMVALAMSLAVQGENAMCVETLGKALQHFPKKAELYSNRGKAQAALGDWQAAADDYGRAAKLSPNSASFQFYLAHALGKIGEHGESRRIFADALRHSPRWPQNAAKDAWRMSTSADFRERMDFWPVCLAEQAIEATGEKSASYLDVLAAAYAQDGRFDEAVSTAKQAIQRAEASQHTILATMIRERLEMYERHQPFREAAAGRNPVP